MVFAAAVRPMRGEHRTVVSFWCRPSSLHLVTVHDLNAYTRQPITRHTTGASLVVKAEADKPAAPAGGAAAAPAPPKPQIGPKRGATVRGMDAGHVMCELLACRSHPRPYHFSLASR